MKPMKRTIATSCNIRVPNEDKLCRAILQCKNNPLSIKTFYHLLKNCMVDPSKIHYQLTNILLPRMGVQYPTGRAASRQNLATVRIILQYHAYGLPDLQNGSRVALQIYRHKLLLQYLKTRHYKYYTVYNYYV